MEEGGRAAGEPSGDLARPVVARDWDVTEDSSDGQRRFREAFEKVPVGMVLKDAAGNLLESNPAFGFFLGYDAEELRSMGRDGLTHPDDAGVYAELYGELVRGEREGFRVEKRYVRKDGSHVWGRLSAVLYGDYKAGAGDEADGRGPLVLAVVEDVDEQRRVEETLNVSERRFRAIVEQSPVSMHVFTPDGRSIATNTSWKKLWNVEKVPEGSDIFEDEQLASTGLLPYVQEGITEGTPVDTPPLRFDPTEVGNEGPERWLEASIYPVRDEEGEVREMALIIEDITEREEARNELEKSEERFRSMIQNSSDIITILEKDGTIRYESPAVRRILGHAPDDLVGENVFDYMHPEDAEKAREAFSRLLKGGEAVVSVTYRFRHQDGSWRHLESVGSLPASGDVGGVVLNSRDVTERVRMEEDLKLKNRAIEASSNGILITGPVEEGTLIVYFNPAMERITGYGEEEVLGRNPRFLQGPDKDQPEARRLQEAIAEGREWSGVLRNYKKDGTLFWNEMYVAPVRDDGAGGGDGDGRITNYIGVQNDVTERKALEERLAYQAFHDSLTGLPNRALFLDRLAHALMRAGRRGDRAAVLFMDLDNFKYVNDSLGHEAGDRFLVSVAERLRSVVRPADTVARFGGDEFVMLLEDLRDEAAAEKAAERIAEEFQRPIALDGSEVYATVSVGIAVSGPDADGVSDAAARSAELLRDADAAMYEAKRRGKDRHQLYEPGINARASERLSLEGALRRAIANGELKLHYQPKVVLESGEVSGVEALVRWQHPEKGMIPPAEFIPLAEETGLIVSLGRWVLREACRQARGWRERHGGRGPSTVWVNLSAREFHRTDMLEEVAAVLEEAGLPPEALGLEITESVLMEHGGASVATLEGLKALGVKLAMDDFGTGYSSLSYLKRLPVDVVKIDRSIVAGLEKDRSNFAIVSSTVMLAHALNLQVVAEGVETADELERLRIARCDLAQGYHISRPLPEDAAERFLFF